MGTYQPAHRTVTCTEYYTRSGVQVEKELINLHTGQSLAQNTIPDAVLIQFDLLMMSTVLLETCTEI